MSPMSVISLSCWCLKIIWNIAAFFIFFCIQPFRYSFQAYNILPIEDFPETIEDDDDDNDTMSPDNKIMPFVPECETTCRIKLLRPELPPEIQPENDPDFQCAVNIKERVEINGKYCKNYFLN